MIFKKLYLKNTKKGKSLFTKEFIKKDEPILEFEKHFTNKRTRTSMQIDENKHQESTDPNALENFINHSCSPNAYIDFKTLTLKALRDINPDEEITFNYNTTEYEINPPIQCKCNSKNCIKEIKGFKHLSKKQQLELKPLLSPFLRKKLKH